MVFHEPSSFCLGTCLARNFKPLITHVVACNFKPFNLSTQILILSKARVETMEKMSKTV